MPKHELHGEFVGKLNIEVFFETLAKLVGEQHGVEITVDSIRRREPTDIERKHSYINFAETPPSN